MDTSALTIDNLLAAPAARALPKPDAPGTKNASCPVADDRRVRVDSSQAEGTDNIGTDTAGTSIGKPAREFRYVLREKTAAESPVKNQKASGSREPDRPQKPTETSAADNVGPVLQNPDATAAGVKSKAASKVVQLMTGLKSEKSCSVTGDAVKSAQIKALAATGEKGQLGLKTVLPPKSNGLNGLKAAPPEVPTILPATKTPLNEKVAGAKVTGKSETIEKLVRQAPDDSGKVMTANKKLQGADISAKGNATKPPAQDAKKDIVPGALGDGDSKKVSTEGTKAPAKNALPPVQAKAVEKPSQAAANDPSKHLSMAEANGKAGVRQTKNESFGTQNKEAGPDGKNAANARSLEKLDAKEVHASDGQPRGRGSSSTKQGPSENFEQILARSNPQSATGSQPAAAAASTKGANLPGQGPPGDVSADVGRQILESIQNSASQQGAERQVTVRLNPPELGQVFIKLQEQNTELTGVLEVSRSQTRFEIEHALPEIIRNLADCGIHVRRFDVVLSEQPREGHLAAGRPEQGTFGEQSMQNNSSGEHEPADQGTWANKPDFSAINEWSLNNNINHEFFEQQETFVTNGSINMLI